MLFLLLLINLLLIVSLKVYYLKECQQLIIYFGTAWFHQCNIFSFVPSRSYVYVCFISSCVGLPMALGNQNILEIC